jgi:hypothetical protein
MKRFISLSLEVQESFVIFGGGGVEEYTSWVGYLFGFTQIVNL